MPCNAHWLLSAPILKFLIPSRNNLGYSPLVVRGMPFIQEQELQLRNSVGMPMRHCGIIPQSSILNPQSSILAPRSF